MKENKSKIQEADGKPNRISTVKGEIKMESLISRGFKMEPEGH